MNGEKETSKATTESDPVSNSDWAELTHECLINILFRLWLEDRWRGAMRVCKAWHEACKDPCLNNSVLDLEIYFDFGTELPRFWTTEFERRVHNMLRSVALWSAGFLYSTCFSDRSLSHLARSCPNLELLSIKSSPRVTKKIMAEIASASPNIKELDISYCYQISHKYVAAIGPKCPNLRILRRNFINSLDHIHVGIVPREYLNACPQDGDIEARAIAKFVPRLLHLEIRCSKLSSSGINSISQSCPTIEYLDLSGCANLHAPDIKYAEINLKRYKTVKKVKICW